MDDGLSPDPQVAFSEVVAVVGLSALGAALAWLRLKGEPAMIRFLLHKFVSRFERQYDYDATYLHELADISPGAFGASHPCR